MVVVEKSCASTDTSGLVASCVTGGTRRSDDDDGDAEGEVGVVHGGEVPVDERVPRRHDVPLIDEGREAFTVQAHRVDAEVDEDRYALRGGDDGGVRLELGDDAVDGGVDG